MVAESGDCSATPPPASSDHGDINSYEHSINVSRVTRDYDEQKKKKESIPCVKKAEKLILPDHKECIVSTVKELALIESYHDCLLICEGHKIVAHKLVLSASSNYLKSLLINIHCNVPVINVEGIKWSIFEKLLQYIYIGEVYLVESQIAEFIASGEVLGIAGLRDFRNSILEQNPKRKSESLGNGELNESVPKIVKLSNENEELHQVKSDPNGVNDKDSKRDVTVSYVDTSLSSNKSSSEVRPDLTGNSLSKTLVKDHAAKLEGDSLVKAPLKTTLKSNPLSSLFVNGATQQLPPSSVSKVDALKNLNSAMPPPAQDIPTSTYSKDELSVASLLVQRWNTEQQQFQINDTLKENYSGSTADVFPHLSIQSKPTQSPLTQLLNTLPEKINNTFKGNFTRDGPHSSSDFGSMSEVSRGSTLDKKRTSDLSKCDSNSSIPVSNVPPTATLSNLLNSSKLIDNFPSHLSRLPATLPSNSFFDSVTGAGPYADGSVIATFLSNLTQTGNDGSGKAGVTPNLKAKNPNKDSNPFVDDKSSINSIEEGGVSKLANDQKTNNKRFATLEEIDAALDQYQRKLAFHEPRPCPSCERMYRDAATLRTHINIMHTPGLEPFQCSCGAQFNTKYEMYHHKKNGHYINGNSSTQQ